MSIPCFRFEWDIAKARSNQRKHGVGFNSAVGVFDDPLAITIADPEHSQTEDRWITLGEAPGRGLLVVVHTYNESIANEIEVRIISARRANNRERRDYEGGRYER
ncbi:MAG: BrnT family toxin [Salinisphaera sp.]|jgi:uncharacterized DUF497 family protein|nr:BrnT family toxin [Salinisphaera sp.]